MSAETVHALAADLRHLGAAIGSFAVLRSWGRAETHYPSGHGVVPDDGLSPGGTRSTRRRPGFGRTTTAGGRRVVIDFGPSHRATAGVPRALGEPSGPRSLVVEEMTAARFADVERTLCRLGNRRLVLVKEPTAS